MKTDNKQAREIFDKIDSRTAPTIIQWVKAHNDNAVDEPWATVAKFNNVADRAAKEAIKLPDLPGQKTHGWFWKKAGKECKPGEFRQIRKGEEIRNIRQQAKNRYPNDTDGYYNHIQATNGHYKQNMEKIWDRATHKKRTTAIGIFTWGRQHQRKNGGMGS